MTGAYIVTLVVLGATVAASQPWIFWTAFALATVAFLLIAFVTRAGG